MTAADSPEGLILERALLGAIASMVPLPFVDDYLLSRSRTTLLRELAARAGLALDAASLKAFATPARGSYVQAAGAGVLSRVLRSATTPIRALGRARAALETFEVATLLDHYARRHHQGLDLDRDRARALRAAFDEVVKETRLPLGALRDPAIYAAALRARFDARWAGHAPR